MIHKNVITNFCSKEYTPVVSPDAFIHPMAAVIGNVKIGKRVMVAPFASIRGDEGQPLIIEDESNIQDGVVIHALETQQDGSPVERNLVEANGQKVAVFIGKCVSLAHQSQIHGPAYVGSNTFIGMKALVFNARVESGCVVEPGCILMGITVPSGKYVPAGTVLKSQEEADNLPIITDDYPFKNLNSGVVHVNTSLADGYNKSEIK